MKSLFNVLKSVQLFVDSNIPSLNCGGCGVFAAIVGAELKRLGFEVGIAVHTYASADVINNARRNNRKTLADWNDEGLSFWHGLVVFKLKGSEWLFDSENLLKKEDYHNSYAHGVPLSAEYLTLQEVGRMSRNPKGWNPRFDRRQIPALRKEIKRIFNEAAPTISRAGTKGKSASRNGAPPTCPAGKGKRGITRGGGAA